MSDMKECINCPYVMTDKCSIWSENGINLCTRKVEESFGVSRFDHALFAERYKPKDPPKEVSTYDITTLSDIEQVTIEARELTLDEKLDQLLPPNLRRKTDPMVGSAHKETT